MTNKTYIAKSVGIPYSSPSELLAYLESLTQPEWSEFLHDLVDDPLAIAQVIGPSPGDDLVAYFATVVEQLGRAASDKVARAIEQILAAHATTRNNEDQLEVACYLASFVRVDATFPQAIIRRCDLPASIRTRAGAALAGSPETTNLLFWRTLDYQEAPYLAAVAIAALADIAPEEALKLLERVPVEATSSLEGPVNAALGSLFRQPKGREWLQGFMASAGAHTQGIIGSCSSYRAMGKIREIREATDIPPGLAPENLKDILVDLSEERAPVSAALRVYLARSAAEQGRSLSDVLKDVAEFSGTNVSRIQELASEELRFPGLKEVWVCAEHPADLQDSVYDSVRNNISQRFIHYYYFQPNDQFFVQLRDQLIRDIGRTVDINSYLHCVILPPTAFITDGFGLLIPEDISHMKGKTVTRMTDDGTIIDAQDMTTSQVRRAYRKLRPYVQVLYGRRLEVLHGETAQTLKQDEDALGIGSSKIQ